MTQSDYEHVECKVTTNLFKYTSLSFVPSHSAVIQGIQYIENSLEYSNSEIFEV